MTLVLGTEFFSMFHGGSEPLYSAGFLWESMVFNSSNPLSHLFLITTSGQVNEDEKRRFESDPGSKQCLRTGSESMAYERTTTKKPRTTQVQGSSLFSGWTKAADPVFGLSGLELDNLGPKMRSIHSEKARYILLSAYVDMHRSHGKPGQYPCPYNPALMNATGREVLKKVEPAKTSGGMQTRAGRMWKEACMKLARMKGTDRLLVNDLSRVLTIIKGWQRGLDRRAYQWRNKQSTGTNGPGGFENTGGSMF